MKDYKTVCKMRPTDKEARSKYDITLKEFKLREFSKCIGHDDSKVTVNIEEMVVESSYTGPRLDDGPEQITPEWVVSLMEW